VKLTELNPKFLPSHGPNGERTEGMGVYLDCPCGKGGPHHRLFVSFSNPIGPGPSAAHVIPGGWQRTGDTFETLTLTPSIERLDSREEDGIGCRWHGFITNGEVITV
jgi:hypothetical protein